MGIEENDAAYLRKARAKVIYGLPGRTEELRVVTPELVAAVEGLIAIVQALQHQIPDVFSRADVTAAVAEVEAMLERDLENQTRRRS